jgi:DNA repair protein RadA/Sms
MAKARMVLTCGSCGHHVAQWAGRCPGCGEWGTIERHAATTASRSRGSPATVRLLEGVDDAGDRRASTGFPGVDRVLGGGLVPGSVALLAGEPGIGKSTLLLHLVAHLASQGRDCLLVSGEESQAQVAARARRLGIPGDAVRFAPGRDLAQVLEAAQAEKPFLLAVDSIQTIRDTSGSQMPGGVSQVRTCADALAGLAKAEGVGVLLTGHVTKDGDLAGPRALEHTVDVVLSFDGDPRSGLRVLSCGKNRFGAEGETAWFEMGAEGLREIDPTALLVSGERVPGAATALVRSGRRALAVEIQALVGAFEGPARRHATGLDLRRFQLVAAVLDRASGLSIGRLELFGASSGGIRIDDPAADLAVAAALASAATGAMPPTSSAFVGEVSLTGQVRGASSMEPRFAAARSAGVRTVFAPPGTTALEGVRVVRVRHVLEAVSWCVDARPTPADRRSA